MSDFLKRDKKRIAKKNRKIRKQQKETQDIIDKYTKQREKEKWTREFYDSNPWIRLGNIVSIQRQFLFFDK